MPNRYKLNESGLCVSLGWRGLVVVVVVLHGPVVIGTDKPCVVEGCTGNGFLGTRGKLRKSGNEEEKVTMSARNVGEKSGVIVRASRDHEKEM